MPSVGRVAPDATHTQSVRFDKAVFSLPEARAWIKAHPEYISKGLDETANQYRFRQYDPDDSKFSYRSFSKGLPRGVSFIIGYKK